MKHKNISKNRAIELTEAIYNITKSNGGYYSMSDEFESLEISEDELFFLLKNDFISDSIQNPWVRKRTIESLIRKIPSVGSNLLEAKISEIKSSNKDGKEIKNRDSETYAIILEGGYYSDMSLIDGAALHMLGYPQVFAANYCSIETLRLIKNSKNKEVRAVAYKRLGPVECLDDMLDDSIQKIRSEGVRRAPLGYHKLNTMVKEIARDVFAELVKKVSPDTLPMFLANRNMKNRWIAKTVQTRLDNGV